MNSMASVELDAVLKELDKMRANEPTHSMIPVLEAYLELNEGVDLSLIHI